MRSENEDQISTRYCVIKQVKIVNCNTTNDCPRLSVRPGSDSYSGIKYNFWAGSRRIRIREPNTSLNPIDNRINTSSSTRNSKKKRRKIYNIRSKPRRRLLVAGFFQAQIRMMKSKHQRKMTYNRSTGTSVPNRISSCGSTSSSSVLIKRKGKMTYNRSTGTSVPNRTSSCGSTSSSSVLIKRKGKITLIDNASPILKKHRKIPDNLNGRTIDDLPKELLAEILKRLPVKYILRCRCVQKAWHSFVQSPIFITYHFNYQKENIIGATTSSYHHYKYLFFRNQLTIRFDDVQCQEYYKIEFPPGLPKYAWFGVSYGLVCVSSTLSIDQEDYNRNIYLWNPLIQKYKTLPESPLPSQQDWEEWEALAFGFVPQVNDYVVVHIIKPYLHPNSHSLIIGVYSLNTNSWKKLRRDNVFISRTFCNDDDVVFVNGAAYWVGVNSDKHRIIMCFDTKTDILSEISLPDWLPPKTIPVIYPFGQYIAYFVWEHRVHHFDMWVLKDHPIHEFIWEKQMCVSTSEDVQEEVLGVRNNGEPILAKSNNFITYNLDSHEANDFVDSWDRWTPKSPYQEGYAPRYIISPFVESLAEREAREKQKMQALSGKTKVKGTEELEIA
ncbi:hypothetical protein AgCh_026421 [Apium graveolens]